MHNPAITEWIVARFTSRERAVSIVGDLVELKPQKGIFWFWLSLARIVFALAWRRLVAFIAAFYAGAWAFSGFQIAIWGVYAQHRPEEFWMPVFGALAGIGAFLWVVFMYAAIRYGLLDRLTQAALALTGLITTIIYYWWQPIILGICIALTVFSVSISGLSRERRRAGLVLFVALLTGIVSWLSTLYLAAQYQHLVYPGPMGDQEVHEHPSVLWVGFFAQLITVWITMMVCSRMHRRLLERKVLDLESEGRLS
jgi:hypothetical protein